METIVVLTRVRSKSKPRHWKPKLLYGPFYRSFTFCKCLYKCNLKRSLFVWSGHWIWRSFTTLGQACPLSIILSWHPTAAVSISHGMRAMTDVRAASGFIQCTGGWGRAVGAGGSVHLAPANRSAPGDRGLPRPPDGLYRACTYPWLCCGTMTRGGENTVDGDVDMATLELPPRCLPLFFAVLPKRSTLLLPDILFIVFVIDIRWQRTRMFEFSCSHKHTIAALCYYFRRSQLFDKLTYDRYTNIFFLKYIWNAYHRTC